jgi:hypothetical protein
MTRHQLDIPRAAVPDTTVLDTIRISSGSGVLKNIPVKSCIFETSHPDEEYHDILVFEVADSWETQISDAPYFFPLEKFQITNRRVSYAVGYPTSSNSLGAYYEIFQPGQPSSLPLARAIMDCELDLTHQSSAAFFRRYNHSHNSLDLDGYSGGAVFSLVGELGSFEMKFDGIIVRAGSDAIFVVDADYLMEVLNK